MKAYHGDPAVKAKFLSRVIANREHDRLLQGYGYWEDGKGCAVGCALERGGSSLHGEYPIQLGIPEWLAHLEDHLFEELPPDDAQRWPEEFLSAIPVGAEIPDTLRDRFQIFWLERQKSQIDCAKHSCVSEAIDGVVSLLRRSIEGDEPSYAAWSAARSAARSAAWSEALVKRDWLLAELKALEGGAA